MNAWLNRFPLSRPAEPSSPSETAALELTCACPDLKVSLNLQKEMGDRFAISGDPSGYYLSGGESGLLYGAWHLIFSHAANDLFSGSMESAPRYAFRMINCWDNPDGSIERGYSGQSLFFRNGKLSYDPSRIQTVARLMASVGLNTLCINNVNVRFPAQKLLEEDLPDLARLAALFRPYGVRLMVSVDFSQPIRSGVSTADPLDAQVQSWWAETARRVWTAVPDLAGFLVKADSEGQPGPFTYGRNHADGANMLANAVQPYGGVIVWRCFVYNCKQDWRDTATDRPKAPWNLYAPLDGHFAENVILQIKNGPFDFQVREPLSPLLLGMPKTKKALELQLAQEYTGHQIDLFTMVPMWKEIFADMPEDRITAIAAVSNWGDDENYTGHPLAAVNLFTYGLLAWNPALDPRQAVSRWIALTYPDFTARQHTALTDLLLSTRRTYEKYTAPLGIGWMVTPHTHYGPNPSGYEYDLWGTYHKANHEAIGIDRTENGTDYLSQYPADFAQKYASPEQCPDLYLLFFHRLPYTWRMRDGRTLIQRIYDDHFEGLSETRVMRDTLLSLPFPEEDRRVIIRRMDMQLANAREWCDVINTFFYRLSGIPDEHGRKIYD